MEVPTVLVTSECDESAQVPLLVKHEPIEMFSTSSSSESSKRNNNNVIENSEEERRKQLCRLRNKEAAARCRKRRLDQTLSLQEEVDKLESLQAELKEELAALTSEQDKLRGILDLHQCAADTKQRKVS